MAKNKLSLIIRSSIIFIVSILSIILHFTAKYNDINGLIVDSTWYTICKYLSFVFVGVAIGFIVIGIIKQIKLNKKLVIFSYVINAISLIILVLIFLFTRIFLKLTISGRSMHPTIDSEDQVELVITNDVNFGDIIVFEVNSDDNIIDSSSRNFIKRVIGLPGDSITYDNNTLYINGERQDETYFSADYLTNLIDGYTFDGVFKYKVNGEIFTTLVIPDGYIFVLGDNRHLGKSLDSKDIGLIPVDNIIGKVIKIIEK